MAAASVALPTPSLPLNPSAIEPSPTASAPMVSSIPMVELDHALGFIGHTANSLAVHPTHPTLIVHSIGKLLLVHDRADPHKQVILEGHDAEVTCVDISPCGRFIVSGQKNSLYNKEGYGHLILWDFIEHKQLYSFKGHREGVMGCWFSPDGRWIASTGGDGRLCLWELETGLLGGATKGATATNNALEAVVVKWVRWVFAEASINNAVSRRPRYQLILGCDRSIVLSTFEFNIKTMAYVLNSVAMQIPASNGGLGRCYTCGCVSLDGQYCFTGSTSGDMIVYSIKNAIYRTALPVTVQAMAMCTLPSPPAAAASGVYVVCVGGADGSVRVLQSGGSNNPHANEKEWRVVRETKVLGGLTNLVALDDQTQMLATTDAGVVYQIRISDLALTVLSHSHTGAIRRIAFPANVSDRFASCGYDGFLRQWDLNTFLETSSFAVLSTAPGNPPPPRGAKNPECIFPLCLGYIRVHGGAANASKWAVLSGWSDGMVRCVDMNEREGKLLWQVTAHRGAVTELAFADHYFVSGGQDGVARIFNYLSREQLYQIHEHSKGAITALAVDLTDVNILHTLGSDKNIFTFDLRRSEAHKPTARRITYHADECGMGVIAVSQRKDQERELVIGTADGRILFYDIDYKDPVCVLKLPLAAVNANNDTNSRKVDFLGGGANTGLRPRANSVTVSPSGGLLACGTSAGTVVLYDLKASPPQFIGQASSHSGEVLCVQWSPDEKQITSCGADCSLNVWNCYHNR